MRYRKQISYEISKLGQCLKQLRQELNLSIRQAAKQCGLAPSYLSKLENGKTFKSINVETLVRLSELYQVPVCSILKEAGISKHTDELPNFAQYLRSKFRLSLSAIRDMEMAKEIVDKKYEGLRERERERETIDDRGDRKSAH